MLFSIEKEEFQQALEVMQSVTVNRIKNGANGLYIKTDSETNIVELEGNNYETQMKVLFDRTVSTSGEVNILAPQLLGIVKATPSKNVIEISYNPDKDARARISAVDCDMKKNKKAYFPVRPAKEFPKIEESEKNVELKLRGETLLKLLKNVAFAASEDKNQYTYNSLIIEGNTEDQTVMSGATNTKQMAMQIHKITEDETIENTKLIISLSTAAELIKILENRKSKDFVEIKTNPNRTKIEFTINHRELDSTNCNEPRQIYLKTSLIQTNYPSFKNQTKELSINKIAVDLDKWKSAINFVNPLSRETKYNTMNFTFKKNEIEVHTEDELGISKTSIPCENGPDKEIQATFNCSFISKFMNQLECETILLQPIENALMQVRVKGDDSFVYVLAPIRRMG